MLQQLAKALRISAEQLYIRAGIVSPEDGVGGSVELAVLNDAGLTERQKQTLLDVYASFISLNDERATTRPRTRRPHDPTPPPEGAGHGQGQVRHQDRPDRGPEAGPKSAQRVFNAGVGVTDLAVEVVRDYVAGTQKRVADVQKSVVDFEPRAFGAQAVKTVNDQALAVPARGRGRRLRRATATSDAYGDLVKRGQTLVGRIRRQQSTQDAVAAAETTVTKAKTTRTQATKAAKKTTTAAKKSTTTAKKRTAATRSSAKATRTSAKKTVSSASRALTDAAAKVGD